jgi:probable rRNA maturation factor
MTVHRFGDRRIDVRRREDLPRLLPDTVLARTIVRALDGAGAPAAAAIGLTLTDDVELGELNELHMGHAGPTDVLSFPLLPPDAFPDHPGKTPPAPLAVTPTRAFVLPPGHRVELGDVVVSVERAIEQAEEGRGGQTGDVRWDARDELRLLVTHGVLHLCGWDHADPVEEAAMRTLERDLLAEAP